MKLHIRLRDVVQKSKVHIKESGSVLSVILKDAQIVPIRDGEPYEGEYEVTPSFAAQTLQTAHKYLENDVTVNAIEVSSVSNPYGGRTVYIGGII